MQTVYIQQRNGNKMLADDLKTFLGSSYAYFTKAWGFHWNVEGSNFGELHKFFSKIYTDTQDSIDRTAEFIRTTNEYAPGSLERFQELSQISGQIKIPRARLMITELLADTQTMIDLSVRLFESAQSERREDIANFAAERQEKHGKYAWQLKSYLKDNRE
jgi:starvation-inducible DNA-binding protein